MDCAAVAGWAGGTVVVAASAAVVDYAAGDPAAPARLVAAEKIAGGWAELVDQMEVVSVAMA